MKVVKVLTINIFKKQYTFLSNKGIAISSTFDSEIALLP